MIAQQLEAAEYLTTNSSSERQSYSSIRRSRARLRAVAAAVLMIIPSTAYAQSSELRLSGMRPADELVPILIPSRTTSPEMSNRAVVQALIAGQSTPALQQPGSRMKWALIGGAAGSIAGLLVFGASFNHQNAPGAIIFLPAYLAAGALAGAGTGALLAR